MLPAIIETERTVLRAFRSTDVDDVFAYAGDPGWNRFSSRAHVHYTRSDAVAFIAAQLALDPNEQQSFAIEHEGSVCGSLKVIWCFEHRIAEIGFGVARQLWGQGIAFEAARALVGAAFSAFPQLIRIRGRCDARNAQSIRVMSKLGMTREAFLRSDRMVGSELVDDVIYGLLRREWTFTK